MRVLDASGRAAVHERLRSSRDGAVVLERLPRAAGQTNWYWCRTTEELEWVMSRLRPASAVSFYFDDRLAQRRADADLLDLARRVLDHDPSICVGWLSADGITIEMDFLGPSEFDEFLGTMGVDSCPFVGPFPLRDDDGVDAITATVPDSDGTVRLEPH